MPLFEYRCETCSQEFEILVRGGEPPACPECGDVHLQKLFSEPAIAQVGGMSQNLPMAPSCPPGPLPCSPTCCRLP